MRFPRFASLFGKRGRQAGEPKPPEKPKATLSISDVAVARSRSKPGQAEAHPFTVPSHPPGVVPAGMAMDENITEFSNWAAAAITGGAFSEGLTFLGYAYLAELAQRPEYRKISEVIAREMTRKWIKIQAKGNKDKTEKIARIEDAMKRLRVQEAFTEVAEQDGFFGRGHIYIDLGTTDDRAELKTPIGDGRNEISRSKIARGSLKRLKTVEAVWCYPTSYNSNDPLASDWYKPSTWFVMGKEVHASRLLAFIGREVPDLLKPAYSFGGLSLSQMAKPYVDNWIRTRQSVSDLIHSFSVNGIKTNLTEALNGDAEGLFRRADLFNLMRDNRGLMLLNKDTEEFFNVSTPLGSLNLLQAQAQEHMAAVSGIPIVKLLGIQPAGLNASSEGELVSFEDWIHSSQVSLFTPNLTRIIGFIQISEFGEVDPDITFVYEPLRSLDKKQQADVRKTEADTDKVMIDSRVISPLEARRRVAADPDTPYPGLDVETLPGMSDVANADIGGKMATVVIGAYETSLIDQATALKGLRKSSTVFSDITDEMIAEAEAEPPAPSEIDVSGEETAGAPTTPGAQPPDTDEPREAK